MPPDERPLPRIRTPRLLLALPPVEAVPGVLDYVTRNREFHAPFSPVPPEGFFTADYWRARLEANRSEFQEDRSMRLFLLDDDERVLGTCNFTQIFRGPFQACYLGFAIDREAQGRGLMHEAADAAIRYVFDELGLHRVMANHLPTNERSARLLRRLGFVVEGYARDYLQIAGVWRDHVLTSRTRADA